LSAALRFHSFHDFHGSHHHNAYMVRKRSQCMQSWCAKKLLPS
jgi:hypothetical protein